MVKTLLVRLGRTYGDGTRQNLMVEPMVRIQFKGVGMVLKGSNRWLLENVSGVYNPGARVAIGFIFGYPPCNRWSVPYSVLVSEHARWKGEPHTLARRLPLHLAMLCLLQDTCTLSWDRVAVERRPCLRL